MPTLGASESEGVLNPARFDGLRGLFAAKVNPVVGLDIIHADACDRTSEPAAPTHDEIAARAYEVYLKRAGRPGSPDGDWAQARRELESESRWRRHAVTE
ncbi:MAG: DUF2934 domain-containing protein [Phycisphaerales bacterium]|nr:DUF2934 domain-containing protein [Phycisphaerales bacterium]